MSLYISPISLDDAITLIFERHKIKFEKRDGMFAISVWDEHDLHGVILMLANSQARPCELVHLYTDGTALVGSLLYGAAWRAAKALGYKTITL